MLEREEVARRAHGLAMAASWLVFVACSGHVDEGTSHRSVVPADSDADVGAGGTGGSGMTTTTPVVTPDASPSTGCVIPPEVQPLPPTMTTSETCSAAKPNRSWSQMGGMVGSDVDGKAKIVGRWLACGTGTFQSEPHAGVEFGANGRFQLLDADTAGTLKANPAVRGRYYLLGSGQMGLKRDDDLGDPVSGVSFSPDGQALVFDDKGSIYARTSPAPDNGDDNAPSTTNGTCSLVGSWSTETADLSAGGKPVSFQFDGKGNFTAEDPAASSPCSPPMYGTFRLSSDVFQITQNVGMGLCQFWFDAGYSITFEANCSRAHLVNAWDNCTGGRGYLNGSSVLVRQK